MYYSPKTSYPDGEPLQMFTAIAIVKGGEVYQGDMGADFHLPVGCHLPARQGNSHPALDR